MLRALYFHFKFKPMGKYVMDTCFSVSKTGRTLRKSWLLQQAMQDWIVDGDIVINHDIFDS